MKLTISVPVHIFWCPKTELLVDCHFILVAGKKHSHVTVLL